MQYKAVFADVDGTLIAPNAGPTTIATEKVITSVQNAVQKGIFFSIATARSINWITGLVDTLRVNAPLILDNGARIYDPLTKKYLFESFLSEKKVTQVLTILEKYNAKITLVPHEDELKRYEYDPKKEQIRDNLTKMIVLHITPELAQEMYQTLLQVPGIAVTKSISGDDPVKESVHVTNFDATKVNALRWTLKYLHLQKEQVIGIGDSYNDKEFLIECGLKVAMGNSVGEIKAIADYIAPSFSDDGVAAVLEKFILNQY